MKRIFLCLSLVLTSLNFIGMPAQAAGEPTIAIIDSGVNNSLFANNIAYEVCLINLPRCPNDKMLNHGTQMASIVTAVNPSAKIIPIRIVGMTPKGIAGLYNLDDVQNALN